MGGSTDEDKLGSRCESPDSHKEVSSWGSGSPAWCLAVGWELQLMAGPMDRGWGPRSFAGSSEGGRRLGLKMQLGRTGRTN